MPMASTDYHAECQQRLDDGDSSQPVDVDADRVDVGGRCHGSDAVQHAADGVGLRIAGQHVLRRGRARVGRQRGRRDEDGGTSDRRGVVPAR